MRVPGPVLGALTALLLAACGSGETPSRRSLDEPVQVVDAAGDTVRLSRPARRVVSLVPSATLTLDAIGARDRLVGRTRFDTVAWVAAIPSVGGGLEPNLEELVALDPDLVIRFGGSQDPTTPARLDELGIPHAAIRPDAIRDVLSSIRIVGTLVGARPPADSLADHLAARLDSLRREPRAGERPRVAYVLGGTPPWVAGPGTYIHELIELVGGENAFADLGSLYASVSLEEFLVRDIDVVVTHDAADVPAGVSDEVPIREVSGALELPGPWVADAAAELARVVYGGARR